MSDIRTLTEAYIAAFDKKDLDAVAALLRDDFILVDPAGRFEGKTRVLDYIGGIFRAAESLTFRGVNIYVDGSSSVIEFELELNGKRLVGTDVIEWSEGRLKELRAYLYETAS